MEEKKLEIKKDDNLHNLKIVKEPRVESKNSTPNVSLTDIKYPPIETVKNDNLTQDDMMGFLVGAIDDTELIGFALESYNQLIDKGIPHIITKSIAIDYVIKNTRDQTPADRERESFRIQFTFTDAKITNPTHSAYLSGLTEPLYPEKCRIGFLTYSGPIWTTANVKITAKYKDGREETKEANVPRFQISTFPIMIRSSNCYLKNANRRMLKNLKEDPNELGGYFIINGRELAIDLLENIAFNKLHIFYSMQQNEILRGEFISQPGNAWDISSQSTIRFMQNGAITIEITTIKFAKAKIPFFLIYRLFGITSDKEIIKSIVYDIDATVAATVNMINIVDKALKIADKDFAPLLNILDREKIVEHVSAHITKNITSTAYKRNENALQYLNQNLLNNLDKLFLPHMGITPETRGVKLRYLGMMIHKLLLTYMGILNPTDRDSYKNKRVHGSGVSLAKILKNRFNQSVTMPILNSLKREVLNSAFESINEQALINAFRNPINLTELNTAIAKAIVAGNKVVALKGGKSVMNRISTQPMERKNTLNTIVTLRTISTHNPSAASKQTERADKMRRVHPTYVRIVCVNKSNDTGEQVGMKKELAITASVCQAVDSTPFKLHLMQDPDIIPLSDIDSQDIVCKNYAKILVDGAWVGCAESAYKIVSKYRMYRRQGKIIDRKASISWDSNTNDVEFWFDVGRLVAPILIVDNNIEEYDNAKMKDPKSSIEFTQNIRFTKQMAHDILTGKITFENLIEMGVAEYITPEEHDNCLVAVSVDELVANRHNPLKQFTHCEVEAAIFGLAVHVGPYPDHTQAVRVTYLSNHARQTGGWYCFSWPYRVDKNRFFQFYNQMPLVRTISAKYVIPNGSNAIVAYAIYYGYNMEDSCIVNKSSIERGLFDGSFFRFEKLELEKGEKFRNT
jgi:DNA-directed RNA polymerase beta subunit